MATASNEVVLGFSGQSTGRGVHTTEYKMVQERYDDIVGAIHAVPSAKSSLISKYKQRGWYTIRETPESVTKENIVDCALERIKQDATECRAFLEMLAQSGVSVIRYMYIHINIAQTVCNV